MLIVLYFYFFFVYLIDKKKCFACFFHGSCHRSFPIAILYNIIFNLQNTNYTPLHMAAINGSDDIVKQLVDNGADIECRDGDHMTPAHR